MASDYDQPRPENGDCAMHHDGGMNVSECQRNRTTTASGARSCPDTYAGSNENSRPGFWVPQESAISRSNPGSSGECRFKGRDGVDSYGTRTGPGVLCGRDG